MRFAIRYSAPLAAALTLALGTGESIAQSQSSKASLFAESGTGFRAAVLTPATQAPALAISGALAGAGGSRTPGRTARAPLFPDGETGVAAGATPLRWSIWGSVGQNNVGYSFEPARSSGRVNLVLGGIDYTFNNNVILGVAVSDDRTSVGTEFVAGSVAGNGYSIAPYVAVPIGRNWVFDASMGWGRNKLTQTINPGAAAITGNLVDARFFSSLALSYAAQMGKLQWTGKGMYLFSEDKVGQFTLSNNTLMPATTTRVGQVRLGGQLTYDAGGFAPYAGLTYIHDVQSPTQLVTAGQTPANDRDAWQLALGVQFYSKGPLSGGVQYTQDTSRAEVKNNMLMGNIAYKF